MAETIQMERKEFLKEHADLPRILREGTLAERKKEAAKQEKEGLALRVRSKLAPASDSK